MSLGTTNADVDEKATGWNDVSEKLRACAVQVMLKSPFRNTVSKPRGITVTSYKITISSQILIDKG